MSTSRQKSRPPVALTIAGSDSGAGAGIQADLKTFAAFRVYGLSVITLVTAQSTQGVDAVEFLPPQLVTQQLHTVFADFNIGAMKTGALGNAEVIHAVAQFLRRRDTSNLVIDPVMISKHGATLIDPDAVRVLQDELLPLARVATPNLSEAAVLAGMDKVEDRNAMVAAAEQILLSGCRSVVVKGGHSASDPVDLLWEDGTVSWFSGVRIDSPHTHGTGCTFSAAIAASLLKGRKLRDAVAAAKRYITGAIEHGQVFGQGINPVNHLWEFEERFGERESD
jgi:hydroxymethylpyrimidine kinase/phosphomethylpyrimidine kinase